MSLLDGVQSRAQTLPAVLSGIQVSQLVLITILVVATFTRFYRLDAPNGCYFDEIYFPTTGAEMLHGDKTAWDFYGHENTHPPLSKEFMALGQGIFGHTDSHKSDLQCWGDPEDASKKTDPSWIYSPFGWRFFGALAGVGAVFFIYLLAKKLFESEVGGLAAAALLTFDGLALAQSRIATPDTYVLFFVVGSLYFLVSDRFLLSGIFFGAASACKWIGAFTMAPIVIYLIVRLIKGIQDTPPDKRVTENERILLFGTAFAGLAAVVGVFGALIGDGFAAGAKYGGIVLVPAVAIWLVALVRIAISPEQRRTPRGRHYLEMALVFPIFFLIVPAYVYMLTYVPMLLNGHSLGDVWDLNRSAYEFHSSLVATHAYSSPWDTWPIMMRPIYLYVASDNPDEKIYNLGNPVLFWMGLPALTFLLWRGLNLSVTFIRNSRKLAVRGAVRLKEWPLLFVVFGYLGMWLPWATQPRLLFIYHYLPALSFVVLAVAYCVHHLWYSDREWGRTGAIAVIVLTGITFVYFYPHLTAMNVSHTVEDSYYWFGSWR